MSRPESGAGQLQVLAVGETMVLVAPDVPVGLERATTVHLDVGGAESNVASHLVQLGITAGWAGAVGADPLGRRLLRTLELRGVDVSLAAIDERAPTGVYFKDPQPGGTNVWYYRSGSAASRLTAGYADSLPLDTVPWVHLTGITPALSTGCGELVDRILERRRGLGLPVSFDVNHRARLWDGADASSRLLELARRSDLVFVGRDEAAALWDTVDARAICDLLFAGSSDASALVVKDGAIGAWAFTRTDPEREAFAPTPPVTVVEPVGAGDAFAAGFLTAVLRGQSPSDGLVEGHRVAATVLASTDDYLDET